MTSPRILIIAVWLIVILAPMPFLSNLLISEEGMFAYLAVKNGKTEITSTRDVILIGRQNGKDRLEAPRHPIMPYWVLLNMVRPFTSGDGFGTLSIDEKSKKARMPFYILYVIGTTFLFGAGACLWKRSRFRVAMVPLSLLAFVGTWRLTVGGAVQTYYDGNYGVLIIAFAALLLIAGTWTSSVRIRWIFLFGGGFLSAMGKNEWALAFLVAIAGTVALRFLVLFLKKEKNSGIEPGNKEFLWLNLALFSGVVAGSTVHYLMDPFNYLQGFSVMVLFGVKSPASWGEAFIKRLPWIWPLVLFAAFSIRFIFKDLKRAVAKQFPRTVLLLWGCVMFCGFMIPPHMGDGFPRYFCPPLIALTAFLLAQGDGPENYGLKPKLAAVTAVFFLALTLFNLGHLYRFHREKRSIGTVPGRSLIQHRSMFKKQYIKFKRTGKTQKVEAALGYYFPEMDFINNT